MDKFELNILGCGSALPTTNHLPSCQVVNFRDNLFMVDCGEGAQLQMRRMKLKFSRLGHIFISHLHGDHCFGLMGLLSTLDMLGRTGEMVIHAPSDAERVFRPQIEYFCRNIQFNVRFDPIDCTQHALIYSDRSLEVHTIPLKHRMPTCGFLFKERARERGLIADMADFYNIPIRERAAIKGGADFVTPEGVIVPNHRLTRPPQPSASYAYCSDTCYHEAIVPLIAGVDLLYHEATFANDMQKRAIQTFHTTAQQAAQIALKAEVGRLIIGHYSARYTDTRVLLAEAKAIFPHTTLANEGNIVQIEHKR